MDVVLDFERPIVELRTRIAQLRELHGEAGVDLTASIRDLEAEADRLQASVFSGLTAWQRTQVARHPGRPLTLDYVRELFTEWTELHGDRAGVDDAAIVGGLARLDGHPVVVIGHQKGRNTKQNLHRNFGMARPEGYRKAMRLLRLAEDFGLPVVTLVDTPGAYPGVQAEANGQAEAIARSIYEMSRLTVPVIAVIVGEGGSGGALAVGVANRVIMLENSVYSVITPEGCAAILWRDRAEAPRAAAALRITAADCRGLGVADEVVVEPLGGAHRDPQAAVAAVGVALRRALAELLALERGALRRHRVARFRALGRLEEVE